MYIDHICVCYGSFLKPTLDEEGNELDFLYNDNGIIVKHKEFIMSCGKAFCSREFFSNEYVD